MHLERLYFWNKKQHCVARISINKHKMLDVPRSILPSVCVLNNNTGINEQAITCTYCTFIYISFTNLHKIYFECVILIKKTFYRGCKKF